MAIYGIKYFLIYRQLNEYGKQQDYTKEFNSQRERQRFIEQMQISARHAKKPFVVLRQWEGAK